MTRTFLRGFAFALVLTGVLARNLPASDDPGASTPSRADTVGKFLAGAAVGLGAHEGAHLVFDVLFDAHPRLKKVEFMGVPFFAIAHRADLSPRREFTISSAGFWMQEATDEWLLSRRPGLRREPAPFQKGVLAFNLLASVTYSGAALARAGPIERDTRGMAGALGISERWIGLMVLAPAVLDAYRYLRPDARWAAWASRGTKIGMVLLVLK